MRRKYLTTDEIVRINEKSIKDIKVKKSDKHEVLSREKINGVISRCKKIRGDDYSKASCLIKGLVESHPFSSGNRRTAFISTKQFLEINNKKMRAPNHKKQAKVMIGIREGFYNDNDIKNWLKNGKIKKFKRF